MFVKQAQTYNENTAASRVLRQKEVQQVYINSSDSEIFVNLPNMIPNFYGSNTHNSGSDNDFYYQFKSFRFRNTFYNLLKNDYIQISVVPVWRTSSSTTTQIDWDIDPITIPLGDTLVDKTVTANELVDILNDNLNQQLQTMWLSRTSLSSEACSFLNVFQYTKFTFDGPSGKLCLYMNGSTAYSSTVSYQGLNAALVPIGSQLYSIVFSVLIPTTLQEDDQVRLARMFGLTNYIQYAAGDIFDENTQIINQLAWQPSYYTFSDKISKTYDYTSGTPYVDDFRLFRTEELTSVKLYANVPMDVFRYDKLYIRSSLQSNIWQSDGRRSNVIAIVPVQTGLTSNAFEYMPESSGDRVYNTKDSLSSLQSFQISITDEYGTKVSFNDPFELVIAIFFTPKDSLLGVMS